MHCASAITTCMSCSTMRIVRSLAMRRTSAMVSWVSAALMPAVGSSRQSSSGSVASAMPIEVALLAVGQVGGELVRLGAQTDGLKHGLRLVDDVAIRAVVPEHAPAVPA